MQMAQDKRHDLAPGILRYWKEKLKKYTDEEICQVLMLYVGEFFPSVDEIALTIERRRELRAEEKQSQPWAEYKNHFRDIDKFMAEHDGKMPQQVWCEENREELARIGEAMRAHNQPEVKNRSGMDGEVLMGMDSSCVGECK